MRRAAATFGGAQRGAYEAGGLGAAIGPQCGPGWGTLVGDQGAKPPEALGFFGQ